MKRFLHREIEADVRIWDLSEHILLGGSCTAGCTARDEFAKILGHAYIWDLLSIGAEHGD